MPADMSRPDAVLITPAMPSERGNGLAMRAGLLLEGLARSFAVKLLVVPVFGAMEAPTPLAENLASQIRILDLDLDMDAAREVIRRLALPGGRALVSAVHPLPGLSRGISVRVAEALVPEVDGAGVVLTMRAYLLPLLDVVLSAAERPKLMLDVDDVESVLHRELGRPDEADRFERLEAHYLPLMDGVIACSREDAASLRARLGLRTVAVIPNAIRPPEKPSPLRASLYDLLFVS